MAIKLISIKCPECGSNLVIEEGRTKIFCSYCGTQFLVQNDNEHVYRYIDEADIKHAENERLIELKKLELEERKIQEKKRIMYIKIIASIICIVATFVGYYFKSMLCFFFLIAIPLIWVNEIS